MRVLYYTYPALLDASLCLMRSLSELVDLHVVLEVAPESRRGVLFDLTSAELGSGRVPADEILAPRVPAGVRSYWKDAGSLCLSVFNANNSFHPSTVRRAGDGGLGTKRKTPELGSDWPLGALDQFTEAGVQESG